MLARWTRAALYHRAFAWRAGGTDQDDGCPDSVDANLHGGNASDALRGPLRRDDKHSRYDVALDGRRFLMVQQKERPVTRVADMIIVQNWIEELKQKVHAK